MIGRLRAWLAGLFGSADEKSDSADASAQFVCSVCGTEVETPEGGCPLCHSTQVVPAGEADAGTDADENEPKATAGAESRREGESTDDAAARLSELRGDEN